MNATGHAWIGLAKGLEIVSTIAWVVGQIKDIVFHKVMERSKIIANVLVTPAVAVG